MGHKQGLAREEVRGLKKKYVHMHRTCMQKLHELVRSSVHLYIYIDICRININNGSRLNSPIPVAGATVAALGGPRERGLLSYPIPFTLNLKCQH